MRLLAAPHRLRSAGIVGRQRHRRNCARSVRIRRADQRLRRRRRLGTKSEQRAVPRGLHTAASGVGRSSARCFSRSTGIMMRPHPLAEIAHALGPASCSSLAAPASCAGQCLRPLTVILPAPRQTTYVAGAGRWRGPSRAGARVRCSGTTLRWPFERADRPRARRASTPGIGCLAGGIHIRDDDRARVVHAGAELWKKGFQPRCSGAAARWRARRARPPAAPP